MLEALSTEIVKKNESEAEAWTMERELLATTVELLHSLVLVTLRVNGATNVGDPIHIPRPYEDEPVTVKPKAVPFSQFVKQSGRR